MKLSKWERSRRDVRSLWLTWQKNKKSIIEQELGTWTFAMIVDGNPYVAHILVHSFDYYLRRLHLRHDDPSITLILCEQHTTCLPVMVEEVFLQHRYEPFQLPSHYTSEKRGTALAKQVVLGQLLTRTISEEEAFQGLARSTRFAYLAELNQLQKPKPGRIPHL